MALSADGREAGRRAATLTMPVLDASVCVALFNYKEPGHDASRRWLQTAQIETAFIDPGKPWQNGADESFNGKFRDQHLSLQWFRNRTDAKVSIEQWRQHYNQVRPHSSLGYLTPAAFKAKHLADVDGGRSPATPARADLTNGELLTDPIRAVLH